MPKRSTPSNRILRMFFAVIVAYLLVAYVLVPFLWKRYGARHPAFEEMPRITYTGSGIPGDPLNVAIIGTKEELLHAMKKAGWHPADRITVESSLRIGIDTIFRREYVDAPVSNLYFEGRKEDLAFEVPFGKDPSRRHHVRFWLTPLVNPDGRHVWAGAATFDQSVGLSHTTGQITHHIGPDIDAERTHVLDSLKAANVVAEIYYILDFHTQHTGKNGGGDPYTTDGRLGVAVLDGPASSATTAPATSTAPATTTAPIAPN